MTPLLLALTLAAPALKEAPKKDAPSLFGEWAVETIVEGGKPEKPERSMTLTFAGDGKCLFREGADMIPDELRYGTFPATDPPEFDLTDAGAGMGAKAMKGIYRFDGDTLTICLTKEGERPTAFASPAGSTFILITCRRVKKD